MHLNLLHFVFFSRMKDNFFLIYLNVYIFKKKKSLKILSRLILVNPVSCLVSWDKCLVTPLEHIFSTSYSTKLTSEGMLKETLQLKSIMSYVISQSVLSVKQLVNKESHKVIFHKTIQGQ